MTLVLTTSKAQLVLVLLFAHKLRSCWCLHTNLTLPDYKIFFFLLTPPPPGIQRWGCKCAQFSVKSVNEPCAYQRTGGGVGILVSDQLKTDIHPLPSFKTFEAISARIGSNSFSGFVVCLHRLQNGTCQFFDEFSRFGRERNSTA